MAKTKEKESNKEIVALSDFEHVLHRPTMYIGSVEKSEEKVVIVEDGKLVGKNKIISVGFYKMLNEIVDNAFDEAKRMKGAMPKILVKIDSKTNAVEVTDTGGGFSNAEKINSKTGQSNVETAMSMLRAGSNFYNDDSSESLIGTNGVGAALVNMLSDNFRITTTNTDVKFEVTWDKFIKSNTNCCARVKSMETGTIVSYVPRSDIFKGCTWDLEYLRSQMIFRNFIRANDAVISNLDFEFWFDGKKIDISENFIPEDSFIIKTDLGIFALWNNGYSNPISASFVNGAICTGIHQKIMTDWTNEIFDYAYAHHFYETFFMLNMPPKLVRFGDQNKTKYAAGRWEIQPMISKSFYQKLSKTLHKHPEFEVIKKKIEEVNAKQDLQKLKTAKKNANKKISDKYFPPSQSKGTLFIVEGSSAMGSILQKRDPRIDAVYSLKGKIKNARSIRDLSTNAEIIDLMNILNLEPNDGKRCAFANVVIATDWDPDGIGHIASLVINLFYKWFPHVITDGKLNILITPLASADIGKERKYFYSLQEIGDFEKSNVAHKNMRYLKGLGSLAIQDWEVIMKNRNMFKIRADRSAAKYMDIAFGTSSGKRKKWLEGDL
jgi:DNA gyrase/topoisomerase IV subunit B